MRDRGDECRASLNCSGVWRVDSEFVFFFAGEEGRLGSRKDDGGRAKDGWGFSL